MWQQLNCPQPHPVNESDLVTEVLQKGESQLREQITEQNKTIENLTSKVDNRTDMLTAVQMVQSQDKIPCRSLVAASKRVTVPTPRPQHQAITAVPVAGAGVTPAPASAELTKRGTSTAKSSWADAACISRGKMDKSCKALEQKASSPSLVPKLHSSKLNLYPLPAARTRKSFPSLQKSSLAG